MTTGPQAREIGLARALKEFERLLAPWLDEYRPVDLDDLATLAVYRKDWPT